VGAHLVWSATEVVRGAHRGVASVGSLKADHAVDVLLDVLDQPLDDIYLSRTSINQSLDGVVNLLLILARRSEL